MIMNFRKYPHGTPVIRNQMEKSGMDNAMETEMM